MDPFETDNSPDELESKILKWLDKTGYPVELFSHKIFHEHGYRCEKSPLYRDPESGSQREIDLVCSKGFGGDYGGFTVEVIVECKKSDKPLIALSTEKESSSLVNSLYGSRLWPSGHSNGSTLAGLGYAMGINADDGFKNSRTFPSAYSIVQAFSTSDEQWFKSILGLAKAEHDLNNKFEIYFRNCINDENPEVPEIFLTIPLLIVDSKVFSVSLGETEPVIEHASICSITFNLPWNDESNSEKTCNVHLIEIGSLPIIIEQIEELATAFSTSLPFKNWKSDELERIEKSKKGIFD